MIPLLEKHKDDVARLCRKHFVRRLEVFGSAADDSFDAQSSDLDFLVEYLPDADERLADTYFGLLFDLEDLFDCKIDLVMNRAIRNPYFRDAVDRSRKVIYAA